MVRLCPPTLALPSAFVSGVKWAGKIPNISLESSSQTAGTLTETAAAPGMEACETDTLIRWHRKGFRLFWKWKSRSAGRPRLQQKARVSTKSSTFRSGRRKHDHGPSDWVSL